VTARPNSSTHDNAHSEAPIRKFVKAAQAARNIAGRIELPLPFLHNECMLKLIAIALLLAIPGQALAATAEEQLAAKVQSVYDKVPSYTADFENEFINKMMPGAGQKASGKVSFKKPGKMRWEYTSKPEQLIISDGKSAWWYQPDLQQVQIADADQYLNNRASIVFLGGQGKLTEEFTIAEGKRPKDAADGDVLELKPKTPDATFSRVLLIVNSKTGLVNETWVYDFLGNATRVRFSNAQTGKKLDDSLFTFTAPKGIDVIDRRQNSPSKGAAPDTANPMK
jgi:outer membrane lipoprotein carrier protein